jgi:hypothetical protein
VRAEKLFQTLPMKELKQASHKFHIEDYEWSQLYESKISITSTANGNPFWLLREWEDHLGHYAITRVEIAADHLVTTEVEAIDALRKAVATITKPRHQRTYVWAEFNESQEAPPGGCLKGPTIYFEHPKSTMRLKLYCRYDKRVIEPFSDSVTKQPLMRIEWSLQGGAIKTHLGGRQLDHLLSVDLNEFVYNNLRVEQINYMQLAHLFSPRAAARFSDPDKRRLTRHPISRWLYYRDLHRFPTDELALLICQKSPAYLRGYLRELRDGKYTRRRGRPKARTGHRKRIITDYQINRCFHTNDLERRIIGGEDVK